MRIEYLTIVDANSSFCRDKSSFNSFLQSNADIKIRNSQLRHKNLDVAYELRGGDAKGSASRFFHMKLECDVVERIDEFNELLKAVRSLLHKVSEKKPQVLWDDVSFHYSQKVYPLIHQIENLMRKLITKFMLTRVGLGWTKEAMPEDLRRVARSDGDNSENNYLYETDFKDLSTFLFDEYRTEDIRSLNEKIKGLNAEAISATELKGFLPRSNWERYFREHVDCEGTYLQSRWDKLYKLRCKVAHNNSFTREDYNNTVSLVDEISPKLTDAIANLDHVEVPEEEREELAEVVASKNSAMYGEYIQRWKELERVLYELHQRVFPGVTSGRSDSLRHIPLHLMKDLLDLGYIGKKTFKELNEYRQVRNVIVHEPGHHFAVEELAYMIKNLDKAMENLANLNATHQAGGAPPYAARIQASRTSGEETSSLELPLEDANS
jgi:hypothetical protein